MACSALVNISPLSASRLTGSGGGSSGSCGSVTTNTHALWGASRLRLSSPDAGNSCRQEHQRAISDRSRRVSPLGLIAFLAGLFFVILARPGVTLASRHWAAGLQRQADWVRLVCHEQQYAPRYRGREA
jgi:hypothetical protein